MGERNGDRSSILYGARTPPGNEQDERTPLVIDLTIEDDDDDSGLGHSDTLIVGDPVLTLIPGSSRPNEELEWNKPLQVLKPTMSEGIEAPHDSAESKKRHVYKELEDNQGISIPDDVEEWKKFGQNVTTSDSKGSDEHGRHDSRKQRQHEHGMETNSTTSILPDEKNNSEILSTSLVPRETSSPHGPNVSSKTSSLRESMMSRHPATSKSSDVPRTSTTNHETFLPQKHDMPKALANSDDLDELEVLEVSSSSPRKRARADSSEAETRTWESFAPNPVYTMTSWVCLGMFRPSVLCMYGLPPELRNDTPDANALVNRASNGISFWAEPGYHPVCIHQSGSSSFSHNMYSSFLRTPATSYDLAVSTLKPSTHPASQPVALNEYGRVSEKVSKTLQPLLQHGVVHCVSRASLVSPLKARAFAQQIETLVFTRGSNELSVLQALRLAGITLEVPTTYRAQDYPGAPTLRVPLQPQVEETLSEQIEPLYMTPLLSSQTRIQQDDPHAQINAIYAALEQTEKLDETEAGPLIVTSLFSHQKQALTFLLERERQRDFLELLRKDNPLNHISLWTILKRADSTIDKYKNTVTGLTRRGRPSVCRGAILADDMGLGKTLTTISLIAHTYDEACTFGRSELKGDGEDDDDEPLLIGDSRNKRTAEQARMEELRCRSRATLLVCPLTVVSNWESQIREHWHPDKQPTVYVYHGSGRTTNPHVLADYDIVITTYSTLGNEFSNQTTWSAAAGRSDEDISSTPKANRLESPNTCQRVEWFRIVLDEAHIVKEARTWQSKAVCNLSAMRRICLTGTPIQNRIDDLYALLVFLRLDPFVDRAVWSRFCGDRVHIRLNSASSGVKLDPDSLKRVQTIMKFLTLRRMKSDTKADGQPLLKLPPKSTRIVTLEFNESERAKYERLHSQFREEFIGYVSEGTVGLNYTTILHEILILRMMCDHAALVDDSIKNQSLEQAENHVLDDQQQKQHATLSMNSYPKQSVTLDRQHHTKIRSMIGQGDLMYCALCQSDCVQIDEDVMRRPVMTKCQHLLCGACAQEHLDMAWPSTGAIHAVRICPVCERPLDVESGISPHQSDVAGEGIEAHVTSQDTGETGPFLPLKPETWPASWSTKLRALISDLLPFSRCNPSSELFDPSAPILDHCVKEDFESQTTSVEVRVCRRHEPRPNPIKSVIFSQWTRMLAKVKEALLHAGIGFRQLDGTMKREHREGAMSEFQQDPKIEVFLVSLRAGGFGLNLVAGCRAYLLDPYWNPAVEQQGLDRIHRLGQKRPIVMTKFIMQRSIEEKLLELQKRKLELASQVGRRTDRRTDHDAKQQRTEDLRLLLS